MPIEDDEKRKLENEVHRMVTNRDPKFTNFLEVPPPSPPPFPPASPCLTLPMRAPLARRCRAPFSST